MITERGYSKDPTIMPEGIVVTFGQQMIKEQGGLKTFLSYFERVMAGHEEGSYWMHTCSILPKQEPDHIYIIIANRLYGRAYFGGFQRSIQGAIGRTANGKLKMLEKPFIILSGPLEKCPFKREIRGFQGFRYCSKLF